MVVSVLLDALLCIQYDLFALQMCLAKKLFLYVLFYAENIYKIMNEVKFKFTTNDKKFDICAHREFFSGIKSLRAI